MGAADAFSEWRMVAIRVALLVFQGVQLVAVYFAVVRLFRLWVVCLVAAHLLALVHHDRFVVP